jgi:predicted DsbA family dithiol-disulfide isomerase
MTKFTIEIYSDTLCPFCYIGKKSLDAAMASYVASHPEEGAEFTLVWRPFLIHPKFRGSVPSMQDYFTAKYGPQKARAFFARVEEKGRPLGIGFRWDGPSGSSWDSHKLLLRAMDVDNEEEGAGGAGEVDGQHRRRGGRMGALLDRLFRGAFEESRDVSDKEFLAGCAVELGVVGSAKEAMEVMENEEFGRRVELESERARRNGIEAVPSYLVQGRYFVGGMQEPHVFEGVFERVGKAGERGSGRVEASEGEICYPVGK